MAMDDTNGRVSDAARKELSGLGEQIARLEDRRMGYLHALFTEHGKNPEAHALDVDTGLFTDKDAEDESANEAPDA